MTDNYRVIETPFHGVIADEILRAVSGQLSDGLWENSRGYDKYWTNFHVKQLPDDRIVFLVSKDSGSTWCQKWLSNPFIDMSDTEFLAWYAGKLKAVIQAEARNNHWEKGWWTRENTEKKSIYLNYKNEVTIADIYCVYDWLLGRTSRSPAEIANRCFGEAATAEVIEKREKIEEAKKKIIADYNNGLAALKAKFEEDKNALNEAYRQQMNALNEAS